MATKTISIDLEAYERLSRARQDQESFSQVIKRIVPRRESVDSWLRKLREEPLSDDVAAAVDEIVKGRLARSSDRGGESSERKRTAASKAKRSGGARRARRGGA